MHTSKPLMLWVDCTSGIPDPEYRVRCAAWFEIVQVEAIGRVPQEIARRKPGALCFEFDYPDQVRLQAMQSIKLSHPRLPILMLTLEHSESLAVWAFRARVWNYLVKPVPPAELSASLDAMAKLSHRTSAPRAPQTLATAAPSNLRAVPIAPEVARLQPALHYVSQHYHERISVDAAARSCGLNRFEFSRRFRAAFGMTFRDYLL